MSLVACSFPFAHAVVSLSSDDQVHGSFCKNESFLRISNHIGHNREHAPQRLSSENEKPRNSTKR